MKCVSRICNLNLYARMKFYSFNFLRKKENFIENLLIFESKIRKL